MAAAAAPATQNGGGASLGWPEVLGTQELQDKVRY